LLPLPNNPTSLSALGLDFRLLGLGPNEKPWARPCIDAFINGWIRGHIGEKNRLRNGTFSAATHMSLSPGS